MGNYSGWRQDNDGSWFDSDGPPRRHLAKSGTIRDEAGHVDTVVRLNADGTAVCPHRDLSVCDACAKDPRFVEVAGAHYFIPDPQERAALARELLNCHEGCGHR